MPRFTSQGWWCWCKQKNSPDSRKCSSCGQARFQRNAQVHVSERAVVYVNPATGERRTPARADTPMPEVYKNQGFERVEIMNMIEYERNNNVVHEATSFNPGNEPVPGNEPIVPKHNPEMMKALAQDMAAAFASGPFTGGLDV